MSQITIDVQPVITDIRIDTRTDPPRLVFSGVLRDTTTGETIRTFHEDVTGSLTQAHVDRVAALAARAQQWAAAKAV